MVVYQRVTGQFERKRGLSVFLSLSFTGAAAAPVVKPHPNYYFSKEDTTWPNVQNAGF